LHGARGSTKVLGLGSQRLNILIVERDRHVRALAAHFLGEAGHRVEVVSDGVEALAHARTLKPDLLVSEILVPKLDGLALCRQLKSDPETAHILVLIVSILAANARVADAGADGFLLKPLAQQRLVGMVEELIDKRSAAGSAPAQERS
jgi:CheY-like chemotaxis protein